MARKVPKRLLALGSAAIVGVYAVGFARTAITPASAGSGVQTLATAAGATQAPPVDASTAIARAIASATASPAQTVSPTNVPSTAAAQVSTAAYRDGTYTGTGSSRMGNITAEVTVQGGQIAAVRITNSTTHYPVSRISQLPGQVVSRQSANISLVSGATYSSNAFKQAVAQALTRASATA